MGKATEWLSLSHEKYHHDQKKRARLVITVLYYLKVSQCVGQMERGDWTVCSLVGCAVEQAECELAGEGMNPPQ